MWIYVGFASLVITFPKTFILDVADEVLDDNGDFNLDHSKDIRELLSLQDISHLNMGEASLYKAKEFSRKHLTSAIEHLDPNLARSY